MIFGDVKRDQQVRVPVDAGVTYLRAIDVPAPGMALARVAALLDGMGGTAGQQSLWAVVYDGLGALRLAGPAVVVTSGQAVGIVEMRMPAGLAMAQGRWWVGVFAGPAGGVARFAAGPLDRSQVAAMKGGGSGPVDTTLGAFSLGAMNLGTTIGEGGVNEPPAMLSAPPANDPAAPVPSVYVHGVPLFVPRAMPDADVVLVPFDEAERVLRASAPAPGERFRATVGWHHLSVDASGDATAIVRSDGPLAGLVGERVLVTRATGAVRRSVAVLVADEQPWPDEVEPEDLSVARRAWLGLGDWALDDLSCTVEVLS